MCGIGGILRTDGEPIPDAWLDAIDARIAYRGPDGKGRFRDRVEVEIDGGKKVVEVALVHRRLSIIDHDTGHQPMVSQRGRNDDEGLVAVVFNGCIYNHRELREELQAAGHTFVTDHSDTEVLIHGWREWGRYLIHYLEGMYAFAIWDRKDATLAMARDTYGEKPMYWRATETSIGGDVGTPIVAFSSEASSMYTIPVPDHVCFDSCREQWLIPYLYLGIGIDLLPGPDLIDVNTLGQEEIQLYRVGSWELDTKEYDATTCVRLNTNFTIPELLEKAVAQRLEADVPLGCFLSGGVDSSLIAHFAKKHKPDLRTFSVQMPDSRYDESQYAEVVAAHLGTNHTTLDVDPQPAEDLVFLIDTLGQPFGDSSILPTYWVSKAAREYVKVVLSGDGGDELFVGYERYLAANFLARNYRWLKHIPLQWMKRFHPKSRWHKIGRLCDMARDYSNIGEVAMEGIFSLAELASLDPEMTDERWKCSINEDHSILYGLAGLSSDPRGNKPDEVLNELREMDLRNYLPNDLLRKVDTASMACALEVRCPFLDQDLAAAVLTMPIDQLIPGGKRKGFLRNIARKYLPKEVVDRPKMGFAIPIGEWFRSDYGGMKTLLLDHLRSVEPFGPISLNQKEVDRYINEHLGGKYDHSQRLFTLLTLSIWAQSLKTPSM